MGAAWKKRRFDGIFTERINCVYRPARDPMFNLDRNDTARFIPRREFIMNKLVMAGDSSSLT